ncbi:DUF6397 family protein [Streptomyces sp. PT12]|uniref:DUF6397 family protein n=1 Tax=Streptomyces sp. PT12 TaxID=1510197 RepID=UPI000DE3D585|nr:DUF6397 family protein [Streptomyces sp. PT12]RBM16650.1 hypothetical protein DEH69_16475 [Streptomyces sp. PT12]
MTATARREGGSVAVRRAAQELGLRPAELDAAVRLGQVATVGSRIPWRRQVPRSELDRLRSDDGFPAALRERSLLVNATAGARLMGIAPGRLARLARCGCFSPVDVRLNHHRVIVWRYVAAELKTFARESPALLSGPVPEEMRRALAAGRDARPRRWRHRRTAQLVRQATTAWQRAAAFAAVLEPPTLAFDVPDPGERALLCRLRPPLIDPPLAAEHADVVGALLTASDPEEARPYRTRLRAALAEARQERAPSLTADRRRRP